MGWDDIMEDELEKRKGIYARMAKSMSCGNCGCIIFVDSEYSCRVCGRMLCLRCGIRWEVCEAHMPMCYHPELVPTRWDQPKPAPARMVGTSCRNYSCPVCGWGIGTMPDSTDAMIEKAELGLGQPQIDPAEEA